MIVFRFLSRFQGKQQALNSPLIFGHGTFFCWFAFILKRSCSLHVGWSSVPAGPSKRGRSYAIDNSYYALEPTLAGYALQLEGARCEKFQSLLPQSSSTSQAFCDHADQASWMLKGSHWTTNHYTAALPGKKDPERHDCFVGEFVQGIHIYNDQAQLMRIQTMLNVIYHSEKRFHGTVLWEGVSTMLWGVYVQSGIRASLWLILQIQVRLWSRNILNVEKLLVLQRQTTWDVNTTQLSSCSASVDFVHSVNQIRSEQNRTEQKSVHHDSPSSLETKWSRS